MWCFHCWHRNWTGQKRLITIKIAENCDLFELLSLANMNLNGKRAHFYFGFDYFILLLVGLWRTEHFTVYSNWADCLKSCVAQSVPITVIVCSNVLTICASQCNSNDKKCSSNPSINAYKHYFHKAMIGWIIW